MSRCRLSEGIFLSRNITKTVNNYSLNGYNLPKTPLDKVVHRCHCQSIRKIEYEILHIYFDFSRMQKNFLQD